MLMLVKRFVFVFTFSSCCCNKLSVFLLLWCCICPRMIVKHQSKPGLCKQHWLRGTDKTKPNHFISSHCSAHLLSGCNVTSIWSVVCQKIEEMKRKELKAKFIINLGKGGCPRVGEAGYCRSPAPDWREASITSKVPTSSAYMTLSKAPNLKTAPRVSVLQVTLCSDDMHV